MRKAKRNVLGHLDKFLADVIAEIKELKGELKRVKGKVEKVFPSRRGRPPKNLALLLGLSGTGKKKAARAGRKKSGAKRGRPKLKKAGAKRGPGRPPKKSRSATAAKRGPGRPPKGSAPLKRKPGRPPRAETAAKRGPKPRKAARRGRPQVARAMKPKTAVSAPASGTKTPGANS